MSRNCLRNGFYLIIISFLFVSCSSSTDSGETATNAILEGTMTLPAVVDGKFYSIIVDNDDNGLNGFIKIGGGTCGSLISVDYSIPDVPAGNYYLSAVVYVVSSPGSIPTTGDYGGFYGSDSIPAAPNVTVPDNGTVNFDFDLTMVP